MEVAKQNDIRLARKLLSESRFRLNEVRTRADELEDTQDTDKKQGFSRFIYAIAMGESAYKSSLPEFKDTHWAGIVIQLDSSEHVDGFADVMRCTQDLESGFYNKGLNYFDSLFLEQRIKVIADYHNRVEAKIDQDQKSRSWVERTLF